MTEYKTLYPNLNNDLEISEENGIEEPETRNNTTRSDEGNGFTECSNNAVIKIIEETESNGIPEDGNNIHNRKATPYMFKNVVKMWKKNDTIKDRKKISNEINDAFILKTAVVINKDNMSTALNRGDFFIARRIWDNSEGKFHDHFGFVKERNEEGLDVIHISDISGTGSTPKEEVWLFEMLKQNIENETVSILRFDFLGLQDKSDDIIERALNYQIPKKETRAFHFASSCAYGRKLPIFSAEQLTLCSENTLLVLKPKETDTPEEDIIMAFHSVQDDGTLNISTNYEDSEITQYSKEELFNYNSGKYNIYYVPECPVTEVEKKNFVDEVLNEKVKKVAKKGTHTLIKKGIKVGARESVTECMKGAVAAKLLAPKVAKVIGNTATGPLLDVTLGSGEAGVATYKSRKKEKVYETSGCVDGYSRTRANKKIASNWSSTASGVAGGLGTAALLTTGAAAAGQMVIPIPFVGAAVGAAVLSPLVYLGSAIGGVASGKIGGLVSSKIYDKNLGTKCPFCKTYTKKLHTNNYMPTLTNVIL